MPNTMSGSRARYGAGEWHLGRSRLPALLGGALLCILWVSAITGWVSAARAQTKPKTDIVFAVLESGPLALDLYPPAPGQGAQGVIVWVHGGAWRAGSRKSVELRGMTRHGWAVASVDYRLSPVARFPAQVHDIKAAIRFLRTHGAEYGLTKVPVVVAGSSAGGHLAALVGVTNGHAELEGSVGSTEGSSHVDGIVDLYGASNLTTILKQSTPHGLSVRKPALDLLLGDQPQALEALAQLASPVFHVDRRDPPLLLMHGDQDIQMPINQAHELHGAYKDKQLSVQMHVVHGAGHGGAGFSDDAALSRISQFLAEQVLGKKTGAH